MGDENGELTEKKETEWLSASVTIYESAVAPNTFFCLKHPFQYVRIPSSFQDSL